MNATKADADKGAKEHPNAPKTKDDLTAEIAKLKKALDECEKDPCGAKGKDESHTPGFPGLNAKPEDLAKWIMDLTYPECTDDKDKTKKEAKQRLEDAKAAAARLPANSQLAEDVKPYLKKLQDFLDKNIDELPPCTVNHLDGYNGLPRPVKLDDDIKKILEWIKTLPPQLPECSDDKEKTKQFVEQMLRDAKDAEDLIKQASQVDKFSKKALEALKESQEAIKKIQDYLATN